MTVAEEKTSFILEPPHNKQIKLMLQVKPTNSKSIPSNFQEDSFLLTAVAINDLPVHSVYRDIDYR